MVRTNIQVYQIPEPAVYARQYTSPLTVNMKGVRRIDLTYPDGAHDAEALFVDPMTGDLFIAIKHSNTSKIYTATKAQLESGNSIPLTLVGSVAFDVVSAADISPDGSEIVFRQENLQSYGRGYPARASWLRSRDRPSAYRLLVNRSNLMAKPSALIILGAVITP